MVIRLIDIYLRKNLQKISKKINVANFTIKEVQLTQAADEAEHVSHKFFPGM